MKIENCNGCIKTYKHTHTHTHALSHPYTKWLQAITHEYAGHWTTDFSSPHGLVSKALSHSIGRHFRRERDGYVRVWLSDFTHMYTTTAMHCMCVCLGSQLIGEPLVVAMLKQIHFFNFPFFDFVFAFFSHFFGNQISK